MSRSDVATTFWSRNFSLIAQAVFGMLPAFLLSLELQVTFYKWFLYLSLVSLTSLSIESIANIRFPRVKGQSYRLKGYITIVVGSSLLVVLACSALLFLSLTTNTYLIILCGVIYNFKLLYISWLRVEKASKLVRFLVIEGILVFVASALLQFIENEKELMLLIFLAKLLPFLLFVPGDILSAGTIYHRVKGIKAKHIQCLFIACIVYTISSFFIVHQSTVLRAAALELLPDKEFIALSIAVSIGSNIQKIILSYYWVIQKSIFAQRLSWPFIVRQLRLMPVFISLGVFALIFALQVLTFFDLEAEFGCDVIACSIILLVHRIASAGFRGMTLSMYGLRAQFERQLGSLFIIVPVVGGLFLVGAVDLVFLIAVVLGIEFFCVYANPFMRGFRSYRD